MAKLSIPWDMTINECTGQNRLVNKLVENQGEAIPQHQFQAAQCVTY